MFHGEGRKDNSCMRGGKVDWDVSRASHSIGVENNF